MCLIIVKKRGTKVTSELYKSISRSYALRNKDGFGFSIKKPNSDIYISKGYLNLKSFILAIKSHRPSTGDELMIHLRKVSAGKKNVENCHPYVCSDKHDEIIQEEGYVKKPVMSHNGTFIKYSYDKDHSDTYLFVKNVLSDINMANILKYLNKKDYTSSISLFIQTSRVAIMYPNINKKFNNPLCMLGKWEFDELSGLYFSNTSYLGDNCPQHGENFKNMPYWEKEERKTKNKQIRMPLVMD
jgi:hypothetical protein